MIDRPHRIVLADDSALYRHLLSKVLDADPELEVVEAVADGLQAVDAVRRHVPDGVVLDLTMPKLDGFGALEQILAGGPFPVVMVSAGAAQDGRLAMQAISRGAFDLFVKPAASATASARHSLRRLNDLVKTACSKRRHSPTEARRPAVVRAASSPSRGPCDVIAIGASTGGVAALKRLATRLGPTTSPIIVAQHMPVGYTATLAEHLGSDTALEVVESKPGLELKPGRMIVCSACDRHTVVGRTRGRLVVRMENGPKEHFQRPAVDVLFRSVASTVGARSRGILLTGMGRDGATGLLAMRESGAETIAESEASAVVYGMPRAAAQIDAADHVLDLETIGAVLATATPEEE